MEYTLLLLLCSITYVYSDEKSTLMQSYVYLRSGSALAITLSFFCIAPEVDYLHPATWSLLSDLGWLELGEWRQFVGFALPGLLMVYCEL